MQKISRDDSTVAVKSYVVLPLVVILVIFLFTSIDFITGRGNILAPAVVLGFGVLAGVSVNILIFSLADEVFDAGNYLKIRRGKNVGIFKLSEIEKIEEKSFSRPAKASIIFLEEGIFGGKIEFIPLNAGSVIPIKSDLLAELNIRIENSKNSPNT